MKKLSVIILLALIPAIFLLSKCNTETSFTQVPANLSADTNRVSYGGYKTPQEWGQHIVTAAGCGDCHTPKSMSPAGPEQNMQLALSGHPANMPAPNVDRKQIESKGLAVTDDLTSWVGPWGISYAANITSDSTTGIGNWSEEQFITCLRKGKYMGLEKARNLLPPMPWQSFRNMTDDELKAVFAYLKSTKPIHNIVPQAAPPLLARKQ
jgi:mono/diheme cytochrome c family protein